MRKEIHHSSVCGNCVSNQKGLSEMTIPIEGTWEEVIRMTEAMMTRHIETLHKQTSPAKRTPTKDNAKNKKKMCTMTDNVHSVGRSK